MGTDRPPAPSSCPPVTPSTPLPHVCSAALVCDLLLLAQKMWMCRANLCAVVAPARDGAMGAALRPPPLAAGAPPRQTECDR